jgi:hypothetical protein
MPVAEDVEPKGCDTVLGVLTAANEGGQYDTFMEVLKHSYLSGMRETPAVLFCRVLLM